MNEPTNTLRVSYHGTSRIIEDDKGWVKNQRGELCDRYNTPEGRAAVAQFEQVPILPTPTWTPTSREQLKGKEENYKTARVRNSGECLQLEGFYHSTGRFKCRRHTGERIVLHWWELDSFTL